MTQPTGTFATNDAIGIREDLSDVIGMISPVETPFFSSVPKGTADATTVEWQTDALASAANNAAIEGDDAPQDSGTATTRLSNRTQIATKDARVTGTMRAVDTAGRSDELEYQLLKRGRELRRDVETSLLANKAKVAGDDTTARELAGVPSWVITNVDAASDATEATGDGTDARTDGTQRAFTEDQLKTVMQLVFDEGGMPDILSVGSFNRQIVSSFSEGRTNTQRSEDNTLHATFDLYESDYGVLRIVPNRFQRARDAFVFQTDMWEIPIMPGRNFQAFDIAKTGDSDARQILIEYSLEAHQEKANGAIYDLTTS